MKGSEDDGLGCGLLVLLVRIYRVVTYQHDVFSAYPSLTFNK
jgi:hypothetical protein